MAIRSAFSIASILALLCSSLPACGQLMLQGTPSSTNAGDTQDEPVPTARGWAPTADTWTTTRRSSEPVIDARPIRLDEFRARRARLASSLGGPCAVWIEARSSEEGMEPFFQADDFQYLTGVDLPDVVLLLEVDAAGGLAAETIYLPARDPMFERWNGARLVPGAEAEAATGCSSTAVLPRRDDAGDARWQEILGGLDLPIVHVLAEPRWSAPEGVAVAAGRDAGSLRQLLSAQRLVKSEAEIACLVASIDITGAALRNCLVEIRPGAFEYQAQAVLESTFKRLGAERPGFSSIFGSGPNSVTLHYDKNRRQMQDGDLMVIDVGAKYQYYCADVSRTVPVNGRFTQRQREIYEIVLAAQTAAALAAKPGMTIKDLDTIARKVITDAGFGDYFLHSVGHWIGLDVHDVGGRVPIVEGCLFTIEPGIYIAEEELGVRIEDDYLMTADGAVRLSVGMPSDPDELMALMALMAGAR